METTNDAPELKRVIDVALPELQELMIVTEACNQDLALSPFAGMSIALGTGWVLICNVLADAPALQERALNWANVVLGPAGYRLIKQ